MCASPILRAGILALTVSGLAVGNAMAQDDSESTRLDMRLSGAVELPVAFDPIEVRIPNMPSSIAELSSQSVAIDVLRTAPQSNFTQPVASALPWYERFTIAAAEPQILWNRTEDFEVSAGERWGVTLSYSQTERQTQDFDLEDFTAGAFFELTERVRLGGEVRFTSPETEIFGEPTEERTPQVRFESAFKF